MYTLIVLGVYFTIAAGFFVAMIMEARKRNAEITFINLVVALIWPIWAIWYSFLLIQEWWRGD